MCSTHCKESRDTWFVNFGQVFDFILILQVAAEIWNLNLNLKTNFDSVDQGADEIATWQHGIGRYRFGFVDLISAVWCRSKGRKRRRGSEAHRREGLRRGQPWCLTAVGFRRAEMAMKLWTRCGWLRWCRNLERRRRSRPESKQRGGWNRQRLRALRKFVNDEVSAEEMRTSVGQKERTSEKKEREARVRVWSCSTAPLPKESMAETENSDERFREDGGISGSRSRGRKGRGLWHLYGGV
jgi:hypothetical protein